MDSFSARISKIGVNPYVRVPDAVLRGLFEQANKTKGPVPVRGRLNGKSFIQTVVKFRGAWRLYLNTKMRRDARVDVGDLANVELRYDSQPRVVPMPAKLATALARNRQARASFGRLSPSHQREILRYLNFLKTEESLDRNVEKVVQHLVGKRPKGLGALMRRRV